MPMALWPTKAAAVQRKGSLGGWGESSEVAKVHWEDWQKLRCGPSVGIDASQKRCESGKPPSVLGSLLITKEGFWEREKELICVRGALVHWLAVEGIDGC